MEIEIEVYTSPVIYAIVRNFCNQEEMDMIRSELSNLLPQLKGPEETGTARTILGHIKKDNKGLFLESNAGIPTIVRKYRDLVFVSDLERKTWFFGSLRSMNSETTLVSYYENSGHYKPHTDESVLTAIYYTWNEPKSFEGGDLYFGNVRINISNNCLVIFPSWTVHEVKPLSGSGRWAITQFLSQVPSTKTTLHDFLRFTNVLTVLDFNSIKKIIDGGKWTTKGKSENSNKISFLHMDLSENEMFTTKFLPAIEKLVGYSLTLDRVYANGQYHGMDGSWHQDSPEDSAFTFLLYMNEISDLNSWEGQTEFLNDDGTIHSVPPETNSAIFFKSNKIHRGRGPSRFVADLRVTVAWKLRLKNV
jgi:Rps23 Pro-64 3,4-dihydroxylase Tpa1-like proline 4-hydroxylase